MNKYVFLSSLAAITLFAGAASAVTVKNTDKGDISLATEMEGKKETVIIKGGESFDSKGKDVTLTLGTEKPMTAKGDESFHIKDGKLMADKGHKEKLVKDATPAPAEAAPAAGTPPVAEQKPAEAPASK
jgi:hypothetical protein